MQGLAIQVLSASQIEQDTQNEGKKTQDKMWMKRNRLN